MTTGYDEELHMQRVALTLEQWPRTDRAWGCENCTLLFATPDNGRCPSCSSESIFDLATALQRGGDALEEERVNGPLD